MFFRTTLRPSPRDKIPVVKLIEALYEDGVFRPMQRVNLIVVRHPDSGRWDLTRLAKTGNPDELALAEQGLAEWASALEKMERS